MAKYKQSYLRLPTDYKGIDVEVRCIGLVARELHHLPPGFKHHTALARPALRLLIF